MTKNWTNLKMRNSTTMSSNWMTKNFRKTSSTKNWRSWKANWMTTNSRVRRTNWRSHRSMNCWKSCSRNCCSMKTFNHSLRSYDTRQSAKCYRPLVQVATLRGLQSIVTLHYDHGLQDRVASLKTCAANLLSFCSRVEA